MTKISRWLGRVVASVVLALSAAPSLAAEPNAALKPVIDAAQKEGKLELMWGPGMIGDSANVKAMGDAMNKMFGTTIAVRYTPGPSEPETLNKVMVAAAAHLPSPSDAVISTNQYAAELYLEGGSVSVDWLSLMPDRIQPQSVEADGAVIRTFTTIPGVIIYNTQLVPEKPTRLSDLLKPEWKGRIASTPYAAGWELITASDVWGKDKALDFARSLSKQVAGLIRCNDLERVASGEFIAFAMNCGGRDWLTMKKNGAPIDGIVPEDFAAERYYYAAIPKNAANPNAAKLFVLFMESSEGQKMVWDSTLTDLHSYPDSHFAPVLADIEKSGVKFREFTVSWFLQHQEALQGQREAVPILAGRS